jgi:DNA polymerase I-like protein with 3'-5' exonuclease and polymerase domains
MDRIKEIVKEIDSFVSIRHESRKDLAQGQLLALALQRDEIKDKRSAERKALTPKIAKLRTKLKQIGDAFNSGNDNHWRWLLFGAEGEGGLGLRATRLTGKAGLAGVDEDDIEELQRIYPEQEILKARVELQHLYRRMRWLKGLKPDHNGRVHIPYSLHRTENGRLASGFDDAEDDKPRESGGGNIQNVPEADRAIFCAEPGKVWIEGDMSQVELRVMAWLARDRELLTALRDGIDIHSENAAAIFGCSPEQARTTMVHFEGAMRPARTAVKRPTHGWDYGLGDVKCGGMFRPCEDWASSKVVDFLAEEFKKSCGVDGMNGAAWARRQRQAERSKSSEIEKLKLIRRIYDEANTLTAKAWRLAYFKRWKGLARFQNEVIEEVERNRVLVNPYGRRLEFQNFRWDYKMQRYVFSDREEALAFLPASTVADEAKAMFPAMEEAAKRHDGELLLFNHDAFCSQVPEKNASAYMQDAKSIMESPWKALGTIEGFGQFSCPAEFKRGPNWGELTKVK